MRKALLAALALLAVAVIGISAWLLLKPRPVSRPFKVGPAMPAGKVTPQLINTWDTAFLLAPDGTIWAWGGNQFQMRDLFGKPTVSQIPLRVDFDAGWVRIAASHMCVLALKRDGSLWGWGNNGSGQLGLPGPTNRPTAVRIGSGSWIQISAGMGHSLGLKSDGSLWAWGQNDRGQVGDGTKSNKFSPTLISDDHDWKTVEAGAFNSFALKTNGTIWGWGLAPDTGSMADVLTPQQLDPATNWASLASGDYCVLALKSDGSLWLRGQNAHVTAADYAKASATNFVQIGTDTDWNEVYVGQSYFIARKKDGSWWVCGSNRGDTRGRPGSPQRLPYELEPWALGCGYGNTVLLTKDGSLWSWGERLGTGLPRIVGAKALVNRVSHLLFRRIVFRPEGEIIDKEPHWLWEVTPEMVKERGNGVVE